MVISTFGLSWRTGNNSNNIIKIYTMIILNPNNLMHFASTLNTKAMVEAEKANATGQKQTTKATALVEPEYKTVKAANADLLAIYRNATKK